PAHAGDVAAQHPPGWPRSLLDRQLDARLHAAVRPRLRALRLHAGRGVVVAAVVLALGRDDEVAVLHRGVLAAVVLEFVVAPAAAACLEDPVGADGAVELVRPDE